MSDLSSMHGAKVPVLFYPDGRGGVAGVVAPNDQDLAARPKDSVVQTVTVDAGGVDLENMEAMIRSIRQSKSLLGEKFREDDIRKLDPAGLRREFLTTFDRLLVMKQKREKLAGRG